MHADGKSIAYTVSRTYGFVDQNYSRAEGFNSVRIVDILDKIALYSYTTEFVGCSSISDLRCIGLMLATVVGTHACLLKLRCGAYFVTRRTVCILSLSSH